MTQAYIDPSEDTTDAPFRRTVGHELEYSSGARLVEVLYDKGHTSDNQLHDYHCGCSSADSHLIHSTSDCTAAGGEYLVGGSQGVLFGSPIYHAATKAMAEAAMEVKPKVDMEVGGHTHVGLDGLDMTAKRRLVRNYLAVQDELVVLYAGSLGRVRSCAPLLDGYYYHRGNTEQFFATPADQLTFRLPSRPTLNFDSGYTVEFRGWNSTRAQWRMLLAGGVSAAMTEAAMQERDAQPGTDLTRHLAGLLRYDVLAFIQRQKKAKGV